MVASGVTVMVTTHFMDEAEYCDRVALIYRGKCIAIDTPDALQASVRTRGLAEPDARRRLHRADRGPGQAGGGMSDTLQDLRPHPAPEPAPQPDSPSPCGAGCGRNSRARNSRQGERVGVRGDGADEGGRWRRMRALIRKEMLQIMRDPSSLVVAVVLPVLLLFLFGFGVSFDVTKMRVGVVIENPTPETVMFEASLANTPFFQVRVAHDRRAFLDDLTASRIEGVVISRAISPSASGAAIRRRSRSSPTAPIPTPASLVTAYVQGAWQTWLCPARA